MAGVSLCWGPADRHMKWWGNMGVYIHPTPLAVKIDLTRLRGSTSRVLCDIWATYSIRVLVFLASPILMSDLIDGLILQRGSASRLLCGGTPTTIRAWSCFDSERARRRGFSQMVHCPCADNRDREQISVPPASPQWNKVLPIWKHRPWMGTLLITDDSSAMSFSKKVGKRIKD